MRLYRFQCIVCGSITVPFFPCFFCHAPRTDAGEVSRPGWRSWMDDNLISGHRPGVNTRGSWVPGRWGVEAKKGIPASSLDQQKRYLLFGEDFRVLKRNLRICAAKLCKICMAVSGTTQEGPGCHLRRSLRFQLNFQISDFILIQLRSSTRWLAVLELTL